MIKNRSKAKKNMMEILWANGYSPETAKDELGYNSMKEDTWKATVEKLNIDYSAVEESDDILTDLYGEYRLDKNLKLFLNYRNVVRKGFVEYAGIGYSELSSCCTGRRRPSALTLKKMAEYFRISPIELVFGIPEIKLVFKRGTILAPAKNEEQMEDEE